MTHPLALNMVLDETAAAYETVASLPPAVERVVVKASGKPGSRMPPGMAEVLDFDEYDRAVTELDTWAEFVAHVLIDDQPSIGSVPDSTPGRLRLAARWADRIEAHPDVMLRYALQVDAREHLATMRRLARRGTRRVRVPQQCYDVTCPGRFVATIEGADADGDLVCPACGWRIPWESWSEFAQNEEYVSVEQAAKMLGASLTATRKRASRARWRRKVDGGSVRYLAADIRESGGMSQRVAG